MKRILGWLSLCLVMVLPWPLLAQNDLDKKLMMGYQGWFLCQGDNAAPNEWRHWFQSLTDPSVSQLNVDMWPDMSEYTTTYATSMNYPNGSNARLFSSHDASTTNLHFKWMKDYNIYGVYLQRFLGEAVNDQRFFQVRNNVLQNVINASATHGRHFAVMYDISGVPDDGNLYNKLVNDWEFLVDNYNVTNRTGYVKQNGLPVLAIWGIGFRDRGLRPETFEQLINYFHNTAAPQYRAYLVGGVPDSWRTLNNDSESDPRWLNIYRSLDMISPWAVGRYGDLQGADNWKTNKIIPDMNDCNANRVDYMPVIFPGFSWYNMHDGARPLNQIPRAGGNFYWRQAYNAISAGSEFIYVAMFDEVDEGTAMFKLATSNANAPAGASMVTLDEDGQALPSDWYLRLANETQRMLDGSAPVSSTIPISPNASAPVVTSNGTAAGVVGSSFNYSITASNSPTSFGASGLPAGLSLNTSSGLISGTPSTAGTFNATITATNATGTGSKSLTITINSSTPVTGMPPNPFIRHMYTADPSAHVWADGRLYVYPSHDIAPPRGADLMDQYHVFSTDDMVNWTDHGEILRASDVPWGRAEGGFMWAPDCAYKNGTYYFYFPHPSGTEWNSTWKIGVATSSSPASNFTVQGYIPGLESLIDPTVFIDDDGQAYFYYGGGGICKGGKLKSNMMEIDGAMQTMQGLVDFHEATWVHKRNGIYYLSYSDNHDVGDAHNQMRYATSTSPLGPWTHRGIYMDPTDSYTNHGSIVEYKGQWYSFYHNSALSGNDWLRSICVDKLFYNADGTIQKVVQTKGHGTPYGGTARSIPGTIQAEDYDNGGAGLAYSDHDAINSGGQYRPSEGVDIEACGEGGFNVGWINNGEWLEYSVNVANAGNYTLNLRVAAETASSIQVDFNGVDKTGLMTVPSTGAWQTYTTISKTVTLSAGPGHMRIVMRGGAFNLNYVSLSFNGGVTAPVVTSSGTASGTVGQSFSYAITASNSPTGYSASGLPPGLSVNTSTGNISGTPTTAGTFNATISATNAGGTGSKNVSIVIAPQSSQSPYGGTPWGIPGTIQAENYDVGGEGIAYHDVDAANTGGQYRNPGGPDIEVCSEGGFNVGWMRNTEWLEYTVNVTTPGQYTLTARVASGSTNKSFNVQLDNVNIGTIMIPGTGGWQNWQTVTITTPSLSTGHKVLRINVTSDDFNLNYLTFTTLNSGPPVVNNTSLPNAVAGTSYSVNINASNSPTSYNATGLPSGLSVSTSTGSITGTPTVTGNFNVVLSATNASGTGSKALPLVVSAPTPVLNCPPNATQGTGFSFTQPTYGYGSVSYAATGLPSGLSVNSTNGTISGTPSVCGTFSVTLTASTSSGTGTRTCSFTVNCSGSNAPVISNSSLTSASVGNNYSVSISATNNPTSYNATGLPVGVSVNTSTGLISGTPTRPGNYSVTLTATNGAGTGSKVLSLNVTEPAGVVSALRSAGTMTVNGNLNETGWNLSKSVGKNTVGTGNNTATFGLLWDNTNLYIGVRVVDGNLFSDSPNPWEDDAVEIYIDANNNKLSGYDGNDNQVIKNYNKTSVFTKLPITGLQHAWAASSGGYSVELAIPWSQLNISAPVNGTKIGFDVGYDDDDNGGARDAQAVWNGTVNNYQNTSAFGTIVLSTATAGSPLAREHLATVEEQQIVESLVQHWPTEVVDVLNITCDGSFERVQVIDLLGRENVALDIHGQQSIVIDVSNIPNGLHIVKMRGTQNTHTFRVIKR